MKKIFCFFAIFSFGISYADAYDFSAVAPSGQTLYYNINGTNVTLTYPGAYGNPYPSGGPTGSLTIPTSVTHGGVNYTVSSIGYMAFYGCDGLTSLTLPSSITSIAEGAFQYCGLTNIHCSSQTPPTLANDYVFDGVGTSISIYVPCGCGVAYQNAWSYFSNFVEPIAPVVSVSSADNLMGAVAVTTAPTCSTSVAVIEAYANDGYHFVRWNDNNTNNPRTLNATNDISFTAYFEEDGGGNPTMSYMITVLSDDLSMGVVEGGGFFEEGTTTTIRAIPYTGNDDGYNYVFVRWQDNNTDNPRTITVTENATYTAFFAEDSSSNPTMSYLISVQSNNPTMGSVEGSGYFEEGTSTTIRANPYNGYRFVRWQDNNTQNPRTITVTGNATYTAYFMATQGIDDVVAYAVSVCTKGGQIVVETKLDDEICIYDIVGRKVDGGRKTRFDVPASGVYFVKIGSLPTQKVVVVK